MSEPCPNCGRLNRAGARFCASCQTPLGVPAVAAPLQPGQMLGGGVYRVVRALGKGGMGAVWLVAQTKAFDRLAVLKEVIDYFDPTDAAERQRAAERFEAEARTLGDLKHPGIPDLYAYFTENGHNYLVMEYIEGPDLSKGLTSEDADTGQLVTGSSLPIELVLRYAAQICEVLEYLASRQPPVIHNDIKPGNIIIDQHSGRAVLVDFGTAKTRYLRATLDKPDGAKVSVYGTVGYAAPELYRGHSESRSDVFSLAATAYHLLTDDDPRDHPFQYPELDSLPVDLTALLQRALAEPIDERPTAAEFRQQLEAYLAGQMAPLRTLPFPDGDEADERDELLTLAIKHWRYAAGLLQDGTLVTWLSRTLHDPAAAQAAEVALRQWPGNPDAALDAFVRKLAPGALPPGKLALRTPRLQLSDVSSGGTTPATIQIANTGKGYLRGEMLSTQPWLRVGSTFACPPGQVCPVEVEIEGSALAPGPSYLGAVTLLPEGGLPEVVAVQVQVAGKAGRGATRVGNGSTLDVNPRQINLGAVSSGSLNTVTGRLTVTNKGPKKVRVRVEGAPGWLQVKPESFGMGPGDRQVVKLVGRVYKLQGLKPEVSLALNIDGKTDQRVDVRMQVKRRGFFG